MYPAVPFNIYKVITPTLGVPGTTYIVASTIIPLFSTSNYYAAYSTNKVFDPALTCVLKMSSTDVPWPANIVSEFFFAVR